MSNLPKIVFNGVRHVARNYQDLLLIICTLTIKSTILNYGLGVGKPGLGLLFANAAVVTLLVLLSIWLPVRARTLVLWIFDILLSVLMFADLVFSRFFHSVITIPVLFEAGNAEGVSGSISALIHPLDLLLFVDLLVVGIYFYFLNKKPKAGPRWRRKLAVTLAAVVFSGGILGLQAVGMTKYFGQNAYIGLNLNNTVLQQMGIVNFHFFDFYNYARQSRAKVSLEGKRQSLLSWIARKRALPATNFTGAAKGKNLIIVQVEAMQGFVINRQVNGQEITPNLNKLIKESMYFDNYFTQIGEGNTSDAEFMDLNSLYPAASGSNYTLRAGNTFQSLPWLLKDAGYQQSVVFHGNKPEFWNRDHIYPQEGFDKFYNDQSFFNVDEQIIMGLSDQSMFRQALPVIKQMPQPNFSFMITLSGHYPYNVPDAKKELNIPPNQYSQIFSDYLQAQHYADKSLGEFIDNLRQQGILDNSLLVIYGDHFGSGFTNQDLEQITGAKQPLNEYTSKELNKVPLLIRLPGGKGAGVKHISGGQMDLLPTLINLLGLDKSNALYFGQDLLNTKEGFSAFRFYSPDGTFATDDVFYIANKDGVFEHGTAYDRKTGQKTDLERCRAGYNRAIWQLSMCDLIIQTNGLPQLIPKIH